MAKKIDPKKWYLASDAAVLLEISLDGLKKKLRNRELAGEQKGAKQKWHMLGKDIIEQREKWNLD